MVVMIVIVVMILAWMNRRRGVVIQDQQKFLTASHKALKEGVDVVENVVMAEESEHARLQRIEEDKEIEQAE